MRRLGGDRRFLVRVIGWAILNWLLEAFALWACVRAFGHSLGPVGLLVAYGLANVAAALPITPGGLGIVEGILVPTLVAFDTARSVAILGVIAFRLASFWLPIPIGFMSYAALEWQFRHHEESGSGSYWIEAGGTDAERHDGSRDGPAERELAALGEAVVGGGPATGSEFREDSG